jgi:hypothetical protein
MLHIAHSEARLDPRRSTVWLPRREILIPVLAVLLAALIWIEIFVWRALMTWRILAPGTPG